MLFIQLIASITDLFPQNLSSCLSVTLHLIGLAYLQFGRGRPRSGGISADTHGHHRLYGVCYHLQIEFISQGLNINNYCDFTNPRIA
jgi:hypothetical protein